MNTRPAVRLRREQLEALQRYPAETFEVRLARHVREVFPDETRAFGEEETARLIDRGVELAGQRGLSSERNITLCVDLLFGLGEDFEERPECEPVAGVLRDETLSENAKMFLVYKKLPEIGAGGES